MQSAGVSSERSEAQLGVWWNERSCCGKRPPRGFLGALPLRPGAPGLLPRGDEGPFPVRQAARQPQPLLSKQAPWDRSVKVFKEVALLGPHTFPFSVVLAL